MDSTIYTFSFRRWTLSFLTTTLRTSWGIRIIITLLVLYYSILWWRRWNTRASRVIRIFITIISCKICKCYLFVFKFSSFCSSPQIQYLLEQVQVVGSPSSGPKISPGEYLLSNWLNKTKWILRIVFTKITKYLQVKCFIFCNSIFSTGKKTNLNFQDSSGFEH